MPKTRHGHASSGSMSAEYRAWVGMKDRCFNPKSIKYKWYGERGISVCDRWKDSFTSFFLDVGTRPSPDHSLGRIDNNGNYEPGNVEWQTEKQQQRNKRDTRIYEYKGRKMCLVDWAAEIGVSEFAIRRRIAKGFPIDEDRRHATASQGEKNGSAKLTAVQVTEIRERYARREVTQSDLSQQYGVAVKRIRQIIKREAWKHIP